MFTPGRSRILTLPNNWSPRFYQLPDMAALCPYNPNRVKRCASVWHRRAGKDSAALNHTAKAAQHRVGVYWHMLPTQKQAREVVWTNVDKQGRRMIDQAFPKELRKRTLEDEMMIEFKNGSFWKLRGADNFDSNVGANPAGIVFSEYSITDPRSWDYMRPILLENEGWAWFIFTPRGDNHAKKLFDNAQKDPLWAWSLWPVDQTKVLTAEQIEQERREGMPEERIQQEYYCRFDVANYGVVYGKEMKAAHATGRITRLPYDARYPVETAWDLGLRDTTAIWFVQRIGKEVRLIDYLVDRNKLIPHYCNEIHKRGYSYSRHILPHDGDRQFMGTGQTIADICRYHGLNVVHAPKLSRANGIEAARALLSRCYFDEGNCAHGIKALEAYHYEWDEEKKVLSKDPVHDWSSHPSDAFRYLAVMDEYTGIMPAWARDMSGVHPSMIGASSGYDPLAAYR